VTRTYLHIPVNIKHERALAKVGHDVVFLLLEADNGIYLALGLFQGDVLESDCYSLLVVYLDSTRIAYAAKLK
jgi:hypothetical protein